MSEHAAIRIHLSSKLPSERRNEPITCGVPFPKGMLHDAARLRMFDAAGNPTGLQARILDRWSDGSARWVLCDWQVSQTGPGSCTLKFDSSASASESAFRVDSKYRIVTSEGLQYEFTLPGDALMSVSGSGERLAFLKATDAAGVEYQRELTSWDLLESGPVRTCVRLAGHFYSEDQIPRLLFSLQLHWFAHSPTVRCHLTVGNPFRADHPGGLWDLGAESAFLLRDLSFQICGTGPVASQCQIQCSPELGEHGNSSTSLELYQDSSGGSNWKSSNHLNRNRTVPNTFQGYRLKLDKTERSGLRSTPIVTLEAGKEHLGASMPYFWQNFPKALEANSSSITLRLLPGQYADLHEIQGGEQKTHVFLISFGRDPVADSALEWTRDPLIPIVDPAWVASTGAIPYLTPRASDLHPGYLQLVDAAIEGSDTFESKREVIDEYGWRHFGDIYGDHEAVFHQGPTPLVSHYNNQYDAVAGLGYQFLRSGDPRWRSLMNELASHVIDIDLYHTDRDKAAYNHGLFWHTYHYVDADTGTHRSYPKNGRIPPKGIPVPGGGPANEQNYATGLMLHYFLTGDIASKEAAVGLAQWVIDMDDGSKTPFRWLARGYTGLASQSRTPDYHGPGRGSANSISALLDGHRLTGDRKFLNKAEQIIQRCIHPKDDVPARNLLDAENRWFYTMFLQALGKYLDYKAELGERDIHYAFARNCLLHYARWMTEHEYPYLEKPELLEYPTETWAAQDMRKCEIFQFASLHANEAERERFRERAEFFFQYSVNKLLTMPTRTLCRPVVLLLSNGFSRAWHKQHPEASAPAPEQEVADFGEPEHFVPQKARAMKRFKQSVLAGGVAGMALLAGLIYKWAF